LGKVLYDSYFVKEKKRNKPWIKFEKIVLIAIGFLSCFEYHTMSYWKMYKCKWTREI